MYLLSLSDLSGLDGLNWSNRLLDSCRDGTDALHSFGLHVLTV